MGRATNSAIQANANKPRPYIGDIMHSCFLRPSDFNHACAVIVSGDSINFCGHALLHIGGTGWYFHVAGFNEVPRFMNEAGYKRYLKEGGKHEIRRTLVPISNPVGAHRKLEDILAKRWQWLLIPNNCASFVEEIVQAGGSKAGLYLNCPTAERFK